ncbi:MAG: hypothetical protein IKB47_04130 [Clostridia bacterium]|nr:hypothetical protein [Clostridia bacterium]
MTENNAYTTATTFKEIRKGARGIISHQGVRLKLVFATLICASAFIMVEYFLSYAILNPVYYFLPWLDAWGSFGVDQAYFVIEFLIFSPLAVGFYIIASRAARQENFELSDMFDFYRSFGRAVRAWGVSAIVFLPIKLCLVLVDVLLLLEITNVLIVVFVMVNLFKMFVLGALVYGRLYTFIDVAVCQEDMKFSRCLGVAIRSTKGRVCEIFCFRMCFVPWVLLSVATVGVLFIIFTIPYIAVAHCHYSSYLITGEHRIQDSEDFHNE